MKLGLYGGTFDPIHIAHLIIAQGAVDELGLDQLMFMPSAITPHKTNNNISSPKVRLEMVNLAIGNNAKFTVSDYEIKKGGISYTLDTLQHLVRLYKLNKSDLFLLIGWDNYQDFAKWRGPEEILKLCTIVVADRPGQENREQNQKETKFLNTPLLDISSTDIRERVKTGKSIQYLVPEPVHAFILAEQLYF